ncbi:MAG: AAA domain protein [Candidatus Methanoperedenaceae archaeon GB50]|nr:MAG: AAA domain protein [Candidatus Methanoperedenaceae archaeon GB50]
MWIKKIKFDDFIIFKNQAFWFTPGLNLIYGPNEAGKTSLLEGIKWSLFGKKGRKKLKNKIEITLVLSEGKEIIINDGLPFFLNMGVDLFENIYFVHTAELDFKEPKRFLTHLKAKLLNLDLLEQAKSEIKELIGKDLQVLNQRILKTGLINERIKGLKEERDQLEHERKLYIEIRTMEHNKRTLEAEERQLKQALSRWEEKNALLQQILKKRTLLERYKRCQALEGYFRERERLEEKLKVLSAFSEEDGERLKEFQVRQASLNQKMQEKKKQIERINSRITRNTAKKDRIKRRNCSNYSKFRKTKNQSRAICPFQCSNLRRDKKSEREKEISK